jgi:uncharacterized protein YqgQ
VGKKNNHSHFNDVRDLFMLEKYGKIMYLGKNLDKKERDVYFFLCGTETIKLWRIELDNFTFKELK